MVNRTNKGNRRELEAKALLEKNGWLVERKNHARFASPDFWGLFDIIAIKEERVALIQVKSSMSHVAKSRRDIHRWIKAHNVFLECYVWLRENKRPWRCFLYDGEVPFPLDI